MGRSMTNNEKINLYHTIAQQIPSLINQNYPWYTNYAQTASILYNSLPHVNWAGFYIAKEQNLILGPFQGKPACIEIGKGRGVCGTSLANKQSIIVDDVDEFSGHIACDSQSRSEIVIPLIVNKTIVAVLDIDSDKLANFDQIDLKQLENICDYISENSTHPNCEIR